jgi:hypothetical protein
MENRENMKENLIYRVSVKMITDPARPAGPEDTPPPPPFIRCPTFADTKFTQNSCLRHGALHVYLKERNMIILFWQLELTGPAAGDAWGQHDAMVAR